MPDSDQVDIAFCLEAAVGVTPANPVFKRFRTTSPNVTMLTRSTESAEMRTDRMTADYVAIAKDVGAELPFEWSYGNQDDRLEDAMCGTWANKPKLFPTAVANGTFTVASGGTAFRKGMVALGVGFGVAANNVLHVVTADASGTSISAATAVAEAAPPAGAYLKVVGFQFASGDLSASGAGTPGNPARITCSSTSGALNVLGLVVGEWVELGGRALVNQFATGALNGWGRISAITATQITFDIVPPGWGTDAGTGRALVMSIGDRLDHGAVRRAYTVQRRFPDLTAGVLYENTRGQEANVFRGDFRMQSIATGSVTLMGNDGGYTQVQLAGATFVDAPSNDVMNTGDDMGRVNLDGVPAGLTDLSYVQNLSFGLNNQMRQRGALGRFGTVSRGLGRLSIDGQVEFIFDNINIAQKAANNSDIQLDWRLGDAAGHCYAFDIPATKVEGNPVVGGTSTDVMLRGTLKPRRHPTLGYMIRIQRYEYLL